jgi:hypothetical protein
MISVAFLAGFLAAVALTGAIAADLRLMSALGTVVISGLCWKLAAIAAALLFTLRKARTFAALESFVSAAILLFFLGDIFSRQFNYFAEAFTRIDVLLIGAVSATCAIVLRRRLSLLLLFTSQLAVAALFLRYADGRVIWSDDHPSFIYRLELLREHFPAIPFYNTDWNTGYLAREFFPTGVLNVFALVSPFLLSGIFGELTTFQGAGEYTTFLALLFVILVPLSVFVAARTWGESSESSTVAALLSLAPTLGYFEWLLKYGTIGFVLSAGLFPLIFSLAAKLIDPARESNWQEMMLLLFVATLGLAWTPAVLGLAPLAVAFVLDFRRLTRKQLSIFATFVGLFLILNGYWLWIFVQESKVASFLATSSIPGAAETQDKHFVFKEILDHFRALLLKANPLLLVAGLAGVLYSRLSLKLAVVWLFALAMFGDFFKPQLELKRMVIIALLLLSLPAGSIVSRLLVDARLGRRRIAAALALMLVMAAPFRAASAYVNRSPERYVFAPAVVGELADAIRQFGGNGRTFFLGFILHDLGALNYASQDGGHIAPLALMSGKELYASHFYHSVWRAIDPIPAAYRERGVEGIEEFLDLVNATSVVTFRKEWASYCRKHPRYKQVFRSGRFRIFQRSGASSFVLEGEASVRRIRRNMIEVMPESEEVVIKYRYLPHLKLSGGEAKISGAKAFSTEVARGKYEDIEYIKLTVPTSTLSANQTLLITY